MRRRRLLSAGFGIPAWGEGSAWAYDLHRMIAGDGFESVLVWLLTEADVFYFQHLLGSECEDPDRLGGVRRCVVPEPIAGRHAALSEMIETFDPDILVGWGMVAVRALRAAAPGRSLIWMGGRCHRLEQLVAEGVVRDYSGFQAGVAAGIEYPVRLSDPERAAFLSCDLAIVPSALADVVQRRLSPAQAGMIYARPLAPADLIEREAAMHADSRRSFAERDVDVVFISPRWDGAVRNFSAVTQICRLLGGRTVHIVGESGACSGVTSHGLLSRRALFELLGRARVAVFPGLADSAGEGVFEAAAMGCNVVASSECGFWELSPPELRVAQPSPAAFVERIARAWQRPLSDERDRFRGDSAELIETLAVF